MHPRELPEPLRERPFGRLEALALGVTPDRLRAQDLDRSVWGVRSPRPPRGIHDRCQMFATRLRGDVVFSHTTAAELLGAPLPSARGAAIHVTVAAPEPAPHAAGLRGHSQALSVDDVQTIDGLSVTSASRTWWDLAGMLPLGDLVAVGDYLVHWRAPLADLLDLGREVYARPGQRGARRARRALELINGRAESAPESLVRVILIEAGLPVPAANLSVTLAGGREVRIDLAYPDARIAIEYSGDDHRDRDQWLADMTRRAQLEAEGWVVIELTADDLRHPDELVERVARALARAR